MIAKTVGKYFEIGAKLGNGAFGEIFKATHNKTHEEAAVKLEKANSKFP